MGGRGEVNGPEGMSAEGEFG
ncbi:hypothetical protein A2U01_0051512, partial [Trifolium medium]|nr:hypothetical protein [Trifolium medium]